MQNQSVFQLQLSFTQIWQMAVRNQLPVAMYRLPGNEEIKLVLSLSQVLETEVNDWSSLPPSILLRSFNDCDLYIMADCIFTFDSSGALLDEIITGLPHEIDTKRNQIEAYYKAFKDTTGLNLSTETIGEILPHQEDLSKAKFLQNVGEALEAIADGSIQKVVISRIKQIHFLDSFDVIEAFCKLKNAYTSAFVSAYFLPKMGDIWMGASPELLASITENGDFYTMALAGTQPVIKQGKKTLSTEAIWNNKEITEQRLVTNYIESCLKKHQIGNLTTKGPYTVAAGNLLHLRTDIVIPGKCFNNDKRLYVKVIEELQPTSAVCGMPKEAAKDFIEKHEPHNREFYCGVIGLINLSSETQFYVNLRSMKLQGNWANLYVGCGITQDSDPEMEFKETQIKSETLLNIICDEIRYKKILPESVLRDTVFETSSITTVVMRTGLDFVNYCYLVYHKVLREGILIDPAWDKGFITEQIRHHEVKIVGILLTHHHQDHIDLSDYFALKFNVKAWMHKKEFEYYEPVIRNLKLFSESLGIKLGDVQLEFFLTPGHTKGSCCFLIDEHLFTGDTLYMEGCGMCEDSGGDAVEMFYSLQMLREKVSSHSLVFAGHSFGKAQGQVFNSLLKSNIYLNISQESQFVKFRLRNNQNQQYIYK